jgi:hypothetical protein
MNVKLITYLMKSWQRSSPIKERRRIVIYMHQTSEISSRRITDVNMSKYLSSIPNAVVEFRFRLISSVARWTSVHQCFVVTLAGKLLTSAGSG